MANRLLFNYWTIINIIKFYVYNCTGQCSRAS